MDNIPDCVKALSTEALQKRALQSVEAIKKSGVCLNDREARAYMATLKGYVHLGDCEVLEKRVEALRLVGLA